LDDSGWQNWEPSVEVENRAQEIQGSGGDQSFEIISRRNRLYNKFKIEGGEITIKSAPTEAIHDPERYVSQLFSYTLENIIPDVPDHYFVGLSIESGNCNIGKELYVPWRRRSQLNENVILHSIENVLNSNETFLMSRQIKIRIHIVDRRKGRGRKMEDVEKFADLGTFLEKHIISPPHDLYCLPEALVMARAKADKNKSKVQHLKNLKDYPYLWINEAKKLTKQSGINIEQLEGCGIEEVKKFQLHLRPEYQIVQYERDDESREAIKTFTGPDAPKKLYIYYREQHYSTINFITRFLRTRAYFPICLEGCHDLQHHRCKVRCNLCGTKHEKEIGDDITCNDCNRNFQSLACYNNHKVPPKGKYSICNSVKLCTSCFVVYDMRKRKQAHECGEKKCKVCDIYVQDDHQCFVTKAKSKLKKRICI